MIPKTVSSREFRDKIIAKQAVDGLVVEKEVADFHVQPDNLLSFIYSSKVIDLAGDVVYPNGIDYGNYIERNPLVLLHHDMQSFPIGKTRSMSVQDDSLIGTIEFFTDIEDMGIGAKARAAMELVRRKTMGISITFLPREFALNDSDGVNFYKSYMVEASVCSVPCCPTAYALPQDAVMHRLSDEIAVAEKLFDELARELAREDQQRASAKRRRIISLSY